MNRRLLSRVPLTFGILAAVGASLLQPISARADDAADGRRRAQRASQLAAKGKCRQAVGEYDKAIAVLHDPALLFNRAECHRKLGNTDAALEDYNQFLADLPTAPNRALVESRISELKKPGTQRGGRAGSAAPVASAGGGVSSSTGEGASKTGPSVAPAEPPQTAGTVAAPAAAVGGDTPRVPAAPAAVPDGGASSNTILLSKQDVAPQGSALPSSSSGDSITGRPWFWIAVGAVVVGAGIGAYMAFGRDATNIPASDLGNYRF